MTLIKLPIVIKIFVLSIFDWSFYTGFTVYLVLNIIIKKLNLTSEFTLLHCNSMHTANIAKYHPLGPVSKKKHTSFQENYKYSKLLKTQGQTHISKVH